MSKNWFAVLCVIVLCGLVFWYWQSHTLGVSGSSGLPTETVQIAGAPVVVEIASTEAEREQGLSGRAVLPDGRGMLFVFDQDGINDKGIWMKDMNFPLDIVWLAADGTIVTVDANVSPNTYLSNPPQVFYPSAPARYVIELPAGFMASLDVGVGDTVQL